MPEYKNKEEYEKGVIKLLIILLLVSFIFGCSKAKSTYNEGYKKGQLLFTYYRQNDGKSPVDIIASESCKLASQEKSELRDEYYSGCIAGFTVIVKKEVEEKNNKGKNEEIQTINLQGDSRNSQPAVAEENKFDNFMEELKRAPGVITAFREGLTLWVQVSGTSEFQARGQEFADMISAWYTKEVGGLVCVRVFYGNRNTIGSACN